MPGVGGNLPAGDQQDLIKVGLQLTLGIVVRDGVVVGDGDEVQLLLYRVLDGDENRAWHHLSRTGWYRSRRCARCAYAGLRDTSDRRWR